METEQSNFDVIVVGAGISGIGAGYHPEKCGDIDLDQIEKKCSAYTPVPGGVGPMTINTLLMQTVEACEKSIQK